MSFRSAIADREKIREAIEVLARRISLRGTELPLGDDIEGRVDGPVLLESARGLAHALSESIRRGSYRPSSAVARLARLDKIRVLVTFCVTDWVLARLFAQELSQRLEPRFAESLHSYRAGRSVETALATVVRTVSDHHRQRPDPRQRGLWVIRRDVSSYTEKVRVGSNSPIWPVLRQAMENDVAAENWLHALLQPKLILGEGVPAREEGVGTPTGSPLTTMIANLYLASFDHELESFARAAGGSLYARYGDDLLFISDQPSVKDEAAARMELGLKHLGLRANERKSADFHWSGSGAFGTQTSLEYLGRSIQFSGRVRLPTEKVRRFLAELDDRLRLASRSLPLSSKARVEVCCRLVATTLRLGGPFVCPEAEGLQREVDCRDQLRSLDFAIAQRVLRHALGESSAKAFRAYPPRKLRQMGLPSLVWLRNRSPGRSLESE